MAAWMLASAQAACGSPKDKPAARPAASASPELGAADRRPPAAERRTVLFIGTSLTAGLGLDPDSAYPQLIQQKIDAAGLPFTVVNAGVSGETSAALRRRIDWLMRGAFDVVVVETGANDGLRGIPVASARRNIAAVLATIRATHPSARVFLVQMAAPPNYGGSYTSAFHAMFPALAQEAGVPLLPFLLDSVAGRSDLNQADGIHPNLRGEHIVADHVWRALEPALRARVAGGD